MWRWFLVLFQCVFIDPQNQVIFVTKNFGRDITRFNLIFTPSEVSFHEDEPLTFLVYDKVSPAKGVSFRFLYNLHLSFRACSFFFFFLWPCARFRHHWCMRFFSISQQWVFVQWSWLMTWFCPVCGCQDIRNYLLDNTIPGYPDCGAPQTSLSAVFVTIYYINTWCCISQKTTVWLPLHSNNMYCM